MRDGGIGYLESGWQPLCVVHQSALSAYGDVVGRAHRASLVQSERYLLCCYRYIELNPVRAGMVGRPEEYRWSSYGTNAWADPNWLSPHEEYTRLGASDAERCAAYRELFRDQLPEEDLHLIRAAAHYCQPVGEDRFRQMISKQYGIKPGQLGRGRPRKPGCNMAAGKSCLKVTVEANAQANANMMEIGCVISPSSGDVLCSPALRASLEEERRLKFQQVQDENRRAQEFRQREIAEKASMADNNQQTNQDIYDVLTTAANTAAQMQEMQQMQNNPVGVNDGCLTPFVAYGGCNATPVPSGGCELTDEDRANGLVCTAN